MKSNRPITPSPSMSRISRAGPASLMAVRSPDRDRGGREGGEGREGRGLGLSG